MKFWELISAFRSETENLKTVFSKDIWKKYKLQFDNFQTLVANQDRLILDEEIPFELAKEVCDLSKLKFYLYYREKPQILSSWKQGNNEDFELIDASDILVRFGGHIIEETMERSYTEINPRQIGENVEVIAVFNLTNIGMVAFLRTETKSLEKDEILSSFDNQRQWKIIGEHSILFNSINGLTKTENQRKQGIKQYKILPLNDCGKPKLTELLKIETS